MGSLLGGIISSALGSEACEAIHDGTSSPSQEVSPNLNSPLDHRLLLKVSQNVMKTDRPILHYQQRGQSDFLVYTSFHEGIIGYDLHWSFDEWTKIASSILSEFFGESKLTLVLPDLPEKEALWSEFAFRRSELLKDILPPGANFPPKSRVWFVFVPAASRSFWKELFVSTEFLTDSVLMTDLLSDDLEQIKAMYQRFWVSQTLESIAIGNWAIPIGDGYGLQLRRETDATNLVSMISAIADQAGWRAVEGGGIW